MNPTDTAHPELQAQRLSVAYGEREVISDLELVVPQGQVTSIVGPNGCGKSTLLRTMARVLSPSGGAVVLDGEPIHELPTRTVARRVGLLPQANVVPEQLTVIDLVSRGRYPHRGPFGRWSDEDTAAVEDALAATSTERLRDRLVDELSGGQRQRVWIAMVLAQRTPVLLLDEPTTYLDLAHRIEVLRLLRELNRDRAVTVVMVLHDLQEAARYSDHLVAMRDGVIVARGAPRTTVTPDLVQQVFGVTCITVPDPTTGAPLVVPVDEPRVDPSAVTAAAPLMEAAT